jgi:hypothetical protein
LWIERAGQPHRTSEDGTPKPQAKGPKEAPLWGLAVLGAGARMANLDPPPGGPVKIQIDTPVASRRPLSELESHCPHFDRRDPSVALAAEPLL